MQALEFKPVWETQSFPIVTEGQAVNLPLVAHIKSIHNLLPGENVFIIGDVDSQNITQVTRDGIDVSFIIENGTLRIPSANHHSYVEVTLDEVIEYSSLLSDIIPGIRIKDDSVVGIVGNIPYQQQHTYIVGFRAKYNSISDVILDWKVNPAQQSMSWDISSLPLKTTNLSHINRSYYTLGDLKYGQKFKFVFDIINPDDIPFNISVINTTGVNPNNFVGLPTGLNLYNDPPRIEGYINSSVTSGKYFVDIGNNNIPSLTINFNVLQNQYDSFSDIKGLTWKTDSFIGEFSHGELCPIKLEAASILNSDISYSLDSGSLPLPTGLVLLDNGEITGTFPYVNSEKKYTIRVKARQGILFTTKEFSFIINNKFKDDNFLTVSLKLSGYLKKQITTIRDSIAIEHRFRPTDHNFIKEMDQISIIDGLKAVNTFDLSYASELYLLLGELKYKETPYYDYIYFDIIDLYEKAGGYRDSIDSLESPVYSGEKRIYQGSINNIRKELLSEVGLNIETDTNNSKYELLRHDSTYSPKMIIAFVNKGMGKTIKNTITHSLTGKLLDFDRLKIESDISSIDYFFSTINDDIQVISLVPLSPYNLQINGNSTPAQKYTSPTLSWDNDEKNVTFTIKIFEAGTLIRTITNLTSNNYKYDETQQIIDGSPSFVEFQVYSVRSGIESKKNSISVLLKSGWGRAWGMAWGR